MRFIFSKTTSFIMALLVLISTFSLNVEKHFCGDFLVDISYFGNTQGCGDELLDDSCDNPTVIKKKNCCSDQVQQIDGQDDLNIPSIEKITLEQQFALAFTVSYYNLFVNLSEQTLSHQQYSPPNLVADIQVIHEVFII